MKKTFWDRTAKSYDHFMKKDHKAYKQMYSLIYPVVRHKQVLELATGRSWSMRCTLYRNRRKPSLKFAGGTFLICNESNGDSDKDEKWTEIIGGMTIYSGDELKTFLENDGFCSKRCPIRRCRAAGGGVNNSCSTVCCPRFAVFAEFCRRSYALCGSGRTDS